MLINFSAGNLIYNLSLKPDGSAKYSRAAGTYCQLIQKNLIISKLRIPSGKIIEISSNVFASLGRVSNLKHNLTVTGKAGRTRLKGFRPIVRGIAMNPVDHPHGGRTNGGRPSVTP
jgi:large subunit ribosomal protein L2